MMYRKNMWNLWEQIALSYLQDQGRKIIQTNFTIRGWELDILAENEEVFLCVEVKHVIIIEDIMAYITQKKLKTLKKTFETYLWRFPTAKQPRLDVIFVKNNEIREHYENLV